MKTSPCKALNGPVLIATVTIRAARLQDSLLGGDLGTWLFCPMPNFFKNRNNLPPPVSSRRHCGL
jgi:hypothetical protein